MDSPTETTSPSEPHVESAELSAPGIARIVVRAPNWLGDAVMALPAIGAIRAAFPGVRLTIAAIASVAPLFAEQTAAAPDEILTLDDDRDEAAALARGQHDVAILLPNSFRSSWTSRRAGIRQRWGYAGSFRKWTLTRAVVRPRKVLHQSAYYLELVRGLGLAADASLPRISVRPETHARAGELLARHGVEPGRRIIGYAPGAAGGHAKRWPPRRVAGVIARMAQERKAVNVLVGAGGDRDAGREIESSLPSGVSVVNLIGATDLRVLAGVLAQCRAFVSNDSGAMHLAAALGVPVTAVFGPTDDRVTAPLGDHDVLVHQVFCRPCMLRDCPIDHRCMKGIAVDAVVEAVARRV